MRNLVDEQGRWNLVDEDCRFCGRPSKEMHPAGVVSGRWLCSCGRKQDEADDQREARDA